jgi:hypothetical protein
MAAAAAAIKDSLRKLGAELGKLKSEQQQYWQDPEALRKASAALDRAIGIEAGRIAPSWVGKLLTKLQPPATPVSDAELGSVGTAFWCAAKARQLKIAGEISEGISKTKLARLLERQMQAAVKTGELSHAVQWPHIRNHLSEWGLWPISLLSNKTDPL